jgi:hypothetical protein
MGGILNLCHRRGRGESPERGGELEPRHRRGEETSNHASGEGKGARTAPPDRGGGLDPRRRRGEVRSNRAAERILRLPSVPIIVIIFNIFTSNNTSTNEGFISYYTIFYLKQYKSL